MGTALALGLAGCSVLSIEEVPAEIGAIHVALEDGIQDTWIVPRYRSFDAAGANDLREVAVYGSTSARVNDGAQVLAADGFASVSSDQYVNLGTETMTGSVYSGQTAMIRGVPEIQDGYRINGVLEALWIETQSDGDFVAPTTLTGASTLASATRKLGFALTQLQRIITLAPTRAAWEVEPGAAKLAVAGNYGHVSVKANGVLLVVSGDYTFDELRLEPDAQLVLCTVSGNPIVINTRQGLDLGDRTRVVAAPEKVLFNHGGVNKARVGSAATFNGTLIAPHAPVEVVGGPQATIRGAFYAKEVEIHQRTVVRHVPFEYERLAIPVATLARKAVHQVFLDAQLAGLNPVDRFNVELQATTQESIDALYAAQVAVEADTAYEQPPLIDLDGLDSLDEQAAYLADRVDLDEASIRFALELLSSSDLDYSDGLDPVEKGFYNLVLTKMVIDNGLSQAMADKVAALADFLVQQNSR